MANRTAEARSDRCESTTASTFSRLMASFGIRSMLASVPKMMTPASLPFTRMLACRTRLAPRITDKATGAVAGFPTLADSKRITTLKAAGAASGLEVAVRSLLGDPAAEAIEQAARGIAAAVGLRDYFSFDFRLDPDGRPWFLEFEVCPAVTIYDFLTYLREEHGTDLPAALARAVPLAFTRRQHRVATS